MYGDQMVRMLERSICCALRRASPKREMAERLEVDKRTVDRLLGVLQDLN